MPPRGLDPNRPIILVDKPPGPSSFAIVHRIRRRTGARTGHAGTLDPFASGLLVLLSGRATKVSVLRFVGLDKRYLTSVDLSARTSTGDPEGAARGRGTSRRPADRLNGRLDELRGEVELPIPARVGGQGRRLERAYKLHRRGCGGGHARAAGRGCTCWKLLGYESGVAELDLLVSSGTYVRAIAGRARRPLRRRCGAPRSARLRWARPTRSA